MLWLIILLVLFILQIAIILIVEFRHPAKTVAWLMILFIFPLIGFIMYYFLAKEYTHRKTVKKKGRRKLGHFQRELLKQTQKHTHVVTDANFHELKQEPRLYGLLNHIPGSLLTRNNQVKVLTNAEAAYKAMLEAIELAKAHIHFEFYTIRHDHIGNQFKEALIRKAEQGVKVRVIYDGVGSYQLSSDYVKQLRQAGIEVYPFLPALIAFFDKRMNYRNHRKIVVVDGTTGFTGGLNIGDEYLGSDPRLGFWRDTHLQLDGDSVYYLQHTFLNDWNFVSKQKLTDATFFPRHEIRESSLVQIISSGPDAHWDSILEMFFGGLVAAHKRIYITTPYFIPDASISMALKTAAISGIDVRIILPEVADSRMVQYASRSYIQELLQAGVRFYLYRKGFVHAKVVIIDHLLAVVGSANMDMRSFFSNFELNAVMFDSLTIQRLEVDFKVDLQASVELKLAEFQKRSRLEKGKEVIARLLSPLF
ncbi:Major cardiolipin synthase ClsA [compost metagenome]